MNNEFAHTQSSLKCTFNGSVFFYCLPSGFQSLSICIAEGLKQLGIPLYSNVNYWRIDAEREDYLFCHNPSVTPDDCAVVVVEKGWILYHRNLPENLFHLARNYITVYLDDADGPSTAAWNPQFRNFDFIFRTHLNSKTEYPTNFVPWVFGLSNRILKETSDLPNFQQRSQHLLVNFRVPQDLMTNKEVSQERLPPGLVRIDPMRVRVEYPLRPIVRNQFCPLIEPILPVDNTIDQFEQPPSDPYHYLQWTQTVQRHHPKYYQRLKAAAACAAFGGYIVPGTNETKPYVEWWDSWRFWESLAAGCVTFHIDFDKYGAVLPVMPKNWQHYIGIDLDNLEDIIRRIATNPEILERISISGRQWAIENYGPIPTAVRFLNRISGNPSQSDSDLTSKDRPLTLSLPIQRNAVMSLPIIFIHTNYKDYLIYSLLQAKCSNPASPIILLGDSTNDCYSFIEHRNILDYYSNAKEFAKVYKHFNNLNPYQNELFCFQRWFILRDFMMSNNLKRCLCLDSDVMFYANIAEEEKKFADFDLTLSYGISPHCVFINNLSALDKFCKFLVEIYTDPAALDYMELTLQECIENNLSGGVSDMTAFKVFKGTGECRIGEISTIIEDSTYDLNMNLPEEFEFENGIKNIYFLEKQPYCKHIPSGQAISFNALHFQGKAKKLMKSYFTGELVLDETIIFLPFDLKDINLIIFPDWSATEALCRELEQVLRAIATRSDKHHITLLIDTHGIAEEDANFVVSGVAMELLMQDDLDVTEGPEISLVGQLREIQWQALLPRLHARIQLEQENQEAIAAANADNIPVWKVDNLIS
jgi:hypothetical protein